MSEHEASSKKLRQAREEGNAGISTFATSAVAFAIGAAVLPLSARFAAGRLASFVRASVSLAGAPEPSTTMDWAAVAREFLVLIVPTLLAIAAAAAVVSGVQAGGVLAWKRLFSFKFDFGKGLRNLASPARAFSVVRSLLAAAAVSWLGYRALIKHARDIAAAVGHVDRIIPIAGVLVHSLVWDVALLGLGIGLADAVITRLQWRKGLRMKDDEVKREHRESDGDPEVKQARKRAHEEMLRAGAINRVKDANVVIVNPTHIACALRYVGEEDDAPMLISSGEGELAEAIKRAAYAYGVPVVQNVPLARALIELPIGDAIPEELYEAVAEILMTILDASA